MYAGKLTSRIHTAVNIQESILPTHSSLNFIASEDRTKKSKQKQMRSTRKLPPKKEKLKKTKQREDKRREERMHCKEGYI